MIADKKLTELEVASRVRKTLRDIYKDYPGSAENVAALITAMITIAATVTLVSTKATDEETADLAAAMLQLANDAISKHTVNEELN